ncbi:hypothetical protein [Terriglobus tenax]|uniref:hypothetical protein n=1 Tax=Terriglobus tenax TaxID=1111115 RepID=UPI0021E056CD|nr:hypothetical protein [Terriglobus tenax]
MSPEFVPTELDQRITQALDHAPQVAVPQDFAVCMASQMPQQAEVRGFRHTYARRLAVVCAVLLAVGVLVLASNTASSFTLMEMLFAVELALLTLWLVSYRRA